MNNADLHALEYELRRASDARELPALPTASVREIRARVEDIFEFEQPRPLVDLIEASAELLRDGTVHTPHPRYFGLFNPAVTPASVAGDALVAAYNPQLAAYSHAPAAQEIERHTLQSLAMRMGLAEGTSGHFTSGGSEANHTAVLLALTRKFPTFGEEGAASLRGPARLYVSELAHDSFTKIAHACGVGRQALRKIAVNDSLQMDPLALQAAIEDDKAAGRSPFLIVGPLVPPQPEPLTPC